MGRRPAPLPLCCSSAAPRSLYQVVQPMSDVPCDGLVVADRHVRHRPPGWVAARGLAGLAGSMALVTRPNLVPLAAVIAAYLVIVGGPGSRVAGAARFVAGLLPGVAVLAWIQRAMYGSPLATGYGSVDAMMAAGHVLPNMRRYAEWLIGAHTPFLLLALAAPAVVRRPRQAWLCLAIAAATLVCYLPYRVFDDWWYTRFLLPAIPLLIVLASATLVAFIRHLAPRRKRLVMAACVTLMALWSTDRTRPHAFDLAEMEQHYYRAGTAVAEHIAETAAIFTVKDSGSVQYHTGRPTLSWDTLEPESLNQALAFVRARGYAAYLLLELDEEPAFRDRFRGGSVVGNLDWPPRVQVGRTIRIYDPMDRQQFLADGKVRTEYLRDPPVPSRDWRRWAGLR